MTDMMRLAVLGGDERQISMSRLLAERGHRVSVFGLGEVGERITPATVCNDWRVAIEEAQAVILPLPVSLDGVRVHMPLHTQEAQLRLSALLDRCEGKYLLGGKLSDTLRRMADAREIGWSDYYESEVLQLKNALPTAEAAVEIAMRELPVTVDGLRVAIIGYGRIGSLLAERLQAWGADVTVYARRREQLALAQLHHHQTRQLTVAEGTLLPNSLSGEYRVVFNTVPFQLFTMPALTALSKSCILIDLASVPGGFDQAAVRELGLRYIWGASLPGKYAPESAGQILAETLEGILIDVFSHKEL